MIAIEFKNLHTEKSSFTPARDYADAAERRHTYGENTMPKERRKITKGRYFVAIPFRTDADRQILDEALAARPDLTAGQVILEALRVYQSTGKNKK